jgi:ABC-type multidrug transport system fused ATPase/permease subunit
MAGGKNLSGGQKQRLTIARAIVKNPEILILDDSSSALDYATDSKLRNSLKTLSNLTVIMVSQRAASLKSADQILVLEDGKCVGLGTHDELLSTCAVYKEIAGS